MGTERQKLTRSIVKVCGVKKRVLLKFGYLVSKNNLLLKKQEKLQFGVWKGKLLVLQGVLSAIQLPQVKCTLFLITNHFICFQDLKLIKCSGSVWGQSFWILTIILHPHLITQYKFSFQMESIRNVLIHSCNTYLLRAQCMSGTVLGAEDTVMRK